MPAGACLPRPPRRPVIQPPYLPESNLPVEFILETRGLTKEFKGFVAVNNVDLKVQRGHIHALIGPNGAGKTTFFNLLTKFLTPTRGSIVYNGTDITFEQPAQTARRGIVRSFQISAVFPHMTVLENVRAALQRNLGTSFHFWKAEDTCFTCTAVPVNCWPKSTSAASPTN
jgi:branched-chain amino acid transport system ATP-binding protein